MSRAADQALGSLISGGLVVTDEAGDVPGWAELIVAGHPIPDGESVRAAHAAIALVERVAPGELLLALVSGRRLGAARSTKRRSEPRRRARPQRPADPLPAPLSR